MARLSRIQIAVGAILVCFPIHLIIAQAPKTPTRTFGKQVHYPEYLKPKGWTTNPRPSHRVDTKVVRLYYFRDAHRVAEIINRNVRRLNLLSVDEARRNADTARDEADTQTIERRRREALAVKAAKITRRTRANLDQAVKQLEQTRSTRDQIDLKLEEIASDILDIPMPNSMDSGKVTDKEQAIVNAIQKTEVDINNLDATAMNFKQQKAILDAKLRGLKVNVLSLRRLKQNQTLLQGKKGRLDTAITAQTTNVTTLRTTLGTDQGNEITTRNEVQKEEEKELLAKKKQFRQEVAAGLADYDTYVAGNKRSVDPVLQVTISVIGEGVLQLRGPMLGINKIRRMVHQIDVPVGQIKVAIHTIQINGEHGDRMELVYERINKYIAYSRFLTNLSGEYLRKAVSVVAGEVADLVDNGYIPHGSEHLQGFDHDQDQRDLKYLYCFFGKDFIDELCRMDSELLNTDNKLVSLHSMASLSLAGALYVTALADNPIRLRIIEKFQSYIAYDLPCRELEYYRTLTRTRHSDPYVDKFIRSGFQWVYDAKDKRRILKNARRSYRFSNSIAFFNAHSESSKVLNSMQYATIRMAHAMKAQLVTETKLRNFLLERSLLVDAKNLAKNKLDRFHRDNARMTRAMNRELYRYSKYRSRQLSQKSLTDNQARNVLEDQLDQRNQALDEHKMLDQFIDDTEEKAVELLEATRSHSANVDNFFKRLAIAFEDDINAQFYEPAFQEIRRASRLWDVSLGQIETTTILTNNRTFAKVSPSATIEFDLPHRKLLFQEALEGSKALMADYGSLMKDGTFLAGAAMLGGQPAAGLANSQSPLQQIPGVSTGQSQKFGSALEKLIPEPSVYKFETGTAFAIKPVIQPDGHSIVYDFNYMYTTQVREPIRADEKHLGRVKRHFVHTDVQTSSYELREVSRYTVALKASRTSRGVPLLEDIPLIGAVFRPLPSKESSLQTNIILAGSVIYPTTFDLMGLRWSPHIMDLNASELEWKLQKYAGRRKSIEKALRKRVTSAIDDILGIGNDGPGHGTGSQHHQNYPQDHLNQPIPTPPPKAYEKSKDSFSDLDWKTPIIETSRRSTSERSRFRFPPNTQSSNSQSQRPGRIRFSGREVKPMSGQEGSSRVRSTKHRQVSRSTNPWTRRK